MLQQQLEQLTNKLGTTRSAMGSIFSAKEKTQALQKQIKILENRLEKQYIKYNEVRKELAGCAVVARYAMQQGVLAALAENGTLSSMPASQRVLTACWLMSSSFAGHHIQQAAA